MGIGHNNMIRDYVIQIDDSLPGASRDIDELERKYGAEELPIILLNIKAEITLNKRGFPPSADYYKALTRCETIIDKYMNRRSINDL